MDHTLSEIYYDGNHPAGFSSITKLYKAAKIIDASIALRDVKVWLSKQLTYTLHKPKRHKFKRSCIVVTDENVQWQADLVDLRMYSKQNRGINYLLTIVDCFSKYAWIEFLKNKSGDELKRAFESIFEEEVPSIIQTDNGKEFLNGSVQSLFKSNNVQFFSTKDGDTKCAIVERFNRTLKDKMFKIMTKTGKRCYFRYIPEILTSYNKSVHSSTGVAPADVCLENRDRIFKKMYGFADKREMLINKHSRKARFQISDLVRIKYQKAAFDRGYHPNWSDEVYEIIQVNNGNPCYYAIKDYQGNKIEGRFYEYELQKVIDPSFRIEKVVRRRVKNGISECFVKWLNFPSTHNSWIPALDIGEV